MGAGHLHGLAGHRRDRAEHGPSLDPRIFHGLNLGIHAVAGILVFLIVRRWVGGVWPAAAGAAVFAVHPIQVEAVAWASGLRDVLAGAMSLAAIWIYLTAADATGRARILWRLRPMSRGSTSEDLTRSVADGIPTRSVGTSV